MKPIYNIDPTVAFAVTENHRKTPAILVSPEGETVIVLDRRLFAKSLGIDYCNVRQLAAGIIETYKGWTLRTPVLRSPK